MGVPELSTGLFAWGDAMLTVAYLIPYQVAPGRGWFYGQSLDLNPDALILLQAERTTNSESLMLVTTAQRIEGDGETRGRPRNPVGSIP